jgi:hypothetical protein
MKTTAAWLAALTLLVVAGCGESDADSDSEPTGATAATSDEPEVSRAVRLSLSQDAGDTAMSATNDSSRQVLVLPPEGEPERSEADEGITLSYVRPEVEGGDESGDEPDLYEAVALPAGATRQLDTSTIGDSSIPVRVCLEIVSTDDVAAPAGSGVFRVDGREGGVAPEVACSGFGPID